MNSKHDMKGIIWKKTALQYACVLSCTRDQQITIWKPTLSAIMAINRFLCKAIQLQTTLQAPQALDTVLSTSMTGSNTMNKNW